MIAEAVKPVSPEELRFWTRLADDMGRASRHPEIVGAGFHNADGSRINAPDYSGTANLVITCGNGSKGSWTQVLAAANNVQDSDGLLVLLNWMSSSNEAIVDIGLGGAGSEVVVAPNLMAQACASSGPAPFQYMLPIPVPSGTRIAARAQAAAVSKSVGVTVWPIAASYLGLLELSRITDYGTGGAAANRGTAVAASATINTKGAWTQLVASTANDIKAIMVAIGTQGSSRSTVDNRLDIGVGGAGSEIVVVPDMYFGAFTSFAPMFLPGIYGPIPIDIPAGTRIAARSQSSTASTSADIVVYGLD